MNCKHDVHRCILLYDAEITFSALVPPIQNVNLNILTKFERLNIQFYIKFEHAKYLFSNGQYILITTRWTQPQQITDKQIMEIVHYFNFSHEALIQLAKNYQNVYKFQGRIVIYDYDMQRISISISNEQILKSKTPVYIDVDVLNGTTQINIIYKLGYDENGNQIVSAKTHESYVDGRFKLSEYEKTQIDILKIMDII